ncbi:MAG TPA: PDDEXK nuclease domain-containing protein [Kofleriaceae bacterium]|nr:PDDEXK nuclease domain-containing protein [Kofleriaceae bacterium]
MPRTARTQRVVTTRVDDDLFARVARILDDARSHVARTVNTTMVSAYWLIGREIVEVEQGGKQRAGYGEQVIARLAQRLVTAFGRGFARQNLRYMRAFYLAFPDGSALPEIRQALPGKSPAKRQAPPGTSLAKRPAPPGGSPPPPFSPALGWTHYLLLTRIANPAARAFYEIEAARAAWSTRELERQIAALLYERLANHRTPEKVRALARVGQEIAKPADVIKDPFVLEFLDLREHPALHERDVEQAIIDRLEAFLLELGKGFSFVGRQVRLTIDADHFYVDLVFYNRLLRCFVLIDLKLGKLTHQDIGQMMMYVNYYDRSQRTPGEAKTVGIVLCSEKNDAMVRITLPEDNDQILAATYKRYLPTEAELAAELTRERLEAEQLLRLQAPAAGDAP